MKATYSLTDCTTASARVELARRVLEAIAQGNMVSFNDAIQLRNWAVRTEDIMLPLAEIARGILDQDKDPEGGESLLKSLHTPITPAHS